jgi:small subunit ribosomal protein S6
LSVKTYEGMFVFDSTAVTDWPQVEAEVNRLISRADGEMIACGRWDERRLAYEIRGKRRGCYVLTYFRAPGDRVAALERDAQLSEPILRCLFLRCDHMTEDEMRAAIEKLPSPEETRGDDGEGSDDDGREDRRRHRSRGGRRRDDERTSTGTTDRNAQAAPKNADKTPSDDAKGT